MNLTDLYPVKPRAGNIGIEIEVEGLETMPIVENEWWSSKAEPSLRNHGMEYITTKPLIANERFANRIKDICDTINSKRIVEDNPRSSIHVHINVSKLSVMHIFNAMTAYWLCENLLMAYCGEDREGNLFCLRLKDAEAIIPMLLTNLEGNTPMSYLDDRYRYAGMNINALNKFGSLEFRGMRGTTDWQTITEWSIELNGMVNEAERYKNPESLFDYFIQVDKRTFLQTFFSHAFVEKLTALPNWQDKMDDSAVLVCNFAYGVEWDEWIEKQKKRIATKGERKIKKSNSIPAWANMEQMYQELSQPAQSFVVNTNPGTISWDTGADGIPLDD